MQDSYGRICSCIRILSGAGYLHKNNAVASVAEEAENGETTKEEVAKKQGSFLRELYLQLCRDSFSDMLRQKHKEDAARKKEKDEQLSVQADDLLVVRQLRTNRAIGKAGFAKLKARLSETLIPSHLNMQVQKMVMI